MALADLEQRLSVASSHAAAQHLSQLVIHWAHDFYPTYSNTLLLLGSPWGVTAPLFMLFLGLALRARNTVGAA